MEHTRRQNWAEEDAGRTEADAGRTEEKTGREIFKRARRGDGSLWIGAGRVRARAGGTWRPRETPKSAIRSESRARNNTRARKEFGKLGKIGSEYRELLERSF